MKTVYLYVDIDLQKLVICNGEIHNENYEYLNEFTSETDEINQIKVNAFIDGFMSGNEFTINGVICCFDETSDVVYCESKDTEIIFNIGATAYNYIDIVQETECVNELLSSLNIPFYEN